MKKNENPHLAAGDECPNCRNGTVDLGEAGELSCSGECGAILCAAEPDWRRTTNITSANSPTGSA